MTAISAPDQEDAPQSERPTQSTTPGYANHKADHLARLRKAEGQVHGVIGMVADDRYCIDVLTQISAVTRALQQVALGLLDDHLRHCVLDAVAAHPGQGAAKLDELTDAMRLAMRL
jgi:DNA-binding FrmR family transcriptional regulator